MEKLSSDINPYASPSSPDPFLNALAPTDEVGSGLPWERHGATLRNWWETAQLVMIRPTQAFFIMRRSGGYKTPVLYAAMGQAIGFVATVLWMVTFVMVVGVYGGQVPPAVAVMWGGMALAVYLVNAVLTATLGLFTCAALCHLALMLVRGTRFPFETTLRVLAFSQGSTAWLNIVPFVGGWLAWLWTAVAAIVGISRAQQSGLGKVIAASLIVLGIMLGLCVLFYWQYIQLMTYGLYR